MVMVSGYPESNRDYTHPKGAYYHYTIARSLLNVIFPFDLFVALFSLFF